MLTKKSDWNKDFSKTTPTLISIKSQRNSAAQPSSINGGGGAGAMIQGHSQH